MSWKGALQRRVDEKLQKVADYGQEKGYPNLGAGATAAGSALTEYALDYVPESVADAATFPVKPLRNVVKMAQKPGVQGALRSGLEKVRDLTGEKSNQAMVQLREEMRKRGSNEEEIRNALRKINVAAQETKP